MTREEALKLIQHKLDLAVDDALIMSDKEYKVFKVCEKALEQEPCEDAISRKEAILQIQRYGVGCFDADEFSPEECERFVISKLNDLPPVHL